MIELKNIVKKYKENTILKDINLKIDKGEFICIIGKSGSGKTTLLNIIGLIDSYNSGEYIFEGENITGINNNKLAKIRRDNIGFVFQSYQLVNNMTVKENVIMPMGYAGVGKKEREERALELLERLEILDKKDNYPSELSGGEKQRVSIARAIANRPRMILADEPTGNLDPANTEVVMKIFSELNKEGITIVMVTHELELKRYATKSIIVTRGEALKEI